MRELQLWPVLLLVPLVGCDGSGFVGPGPGGDPAPPRDLDAFYYAGAVHISWRLDAAWREESFRVYGRRTTDRDPFLLAQVTSCIEGECGYTDRNILPSTTYEYYVAAVDSRSGRETPSDYSVEVAVPSMTPPSPPSELDAVALDGALYLQWGLGDLDEEVHFFRVYVEGEGGDGFFVGETDSPGFVDLRVHNGTTYRYFVTAVDGWGHESEGSAWASTTPRPDFHGELLYAYEDGPDRSGFRFPESELDDPIRHGNHPDRHFRLEVDDEGWWLVPGPDVEVHRDAFLTTALRCGPGADASCVELSQAPAGGYVHAHLGLAVGYTYVLRVPGDGGGARYGALRVTHLGVAQDGAVVLFDWAHQLQEGNRELVPPQP